MKKLNSEQWGKLYSLDRAEMIAKNIKEKKYSSQTEEMIKILSQKQGEIEACEIGCGSGQTVLCLAQMGVRVTALDYQEESLLLIKKVAEMLGDKTVDNIKIVCADATRELPFKEKQFDVVYHAGLLEHFSMEERIQMLSLWKHYCKEMISMVPNAASVGYRYGKAKLINSNRWTYGQENIIYSQVLEFIKAGIEVEEEYTIGLPNSLNFLDDRNYLKRAFKKLWSENILEDDCHQGYLLLTRGKC